MSGVGNGFWKEGPLWRQKLGLPKKDKKRKFKFRDIKKQHMSKRRRLELKRLHELAHRPVDLKPRLRKDSDV